MKLTLILSVVIGLYATQVLADYEKGVMEYRRGNYASAIHEWRQLAEQGDTRAQHSLAMMHENGDGVAASEEEAKKWYRLAADQGYMPAQLSLAELHMRRQGDDTSFVEEAALWYRRAAEQGSEAAQFQLGLLYLEGRGVAQDDGQAAVWFEAAAQQGVTNAQNNVGSMYENGRGVEQDYSRAFEWYERAARAGDAYAQNNLGALYAQGRGVEQNHAWAVFWFATALQNGNSIAAGNIEPSLEGLEMRQVSSAQANIRSGNSTEHDVVSSAEYGDELYVLGNINEWTQVYFPKEKVLGWISSSLME
ncbi:SH3 domain-containing protein [Halomonas salipaludis]|uniref:SH3b domain-containing protein n=1 Tax=Halomonas salipaludis TaxID=2032625 RepID=A0A2A2EVZ2_9GAMM|nr:SH3 domain-containing protein [Halomonas salipaludis]PAU76634.1 hypothetical protein CK498_11620 [Halomonas salipaludis]